MGTRASFKDFINKSFNGTLTKQLSWNIGAISVILLVVAAFFISSKISNSYKKISKTYITTVAEKYAESTKQILSKEYSLCTELQSAFSLYESIPAESRRDYYNALLKDTLKANPSLVDAWTVWEPDALDGMDGVYANTDVHDETGRFIPYWTNSDGKIDVCALTDYVGSSWYDVPLKSRYGILIDPNPYEVAGKVIWVCGVAFPIVNTRGERVGVVGIDMSLSTLTDLLKSAEIYESGYLSLISASGLVAVDKDTQNEGKVDKNFSDSKKSTLFKEAAKTLEEFQGSETVDGKRMFTITIPLKVDIAEQIWYLEVNVEEAELEREAKLVSAILICSFIVLTIVIVITIVAIVKGTTNEINKGVDAMKNIAQGDGDLTVRMEVKRHNEIGLM
ncbi:MAG: methyl-accepting chemotaxis protein, partial [Treponema sp.]|nr:methyl-accepting chemotaxis protein [Treponema sp.]